MSAVESIKRGLARAYDRLRSWAKSVPPDVWIGLAIAAATLIVVYLAYRNSKTSGSTLAPSSITPLDSAVVPTVDSSTSTLPTIPDLSSLFTNSGIPSSATNGASNSPGTIVTPVVNMAHAIAQQMQVQQARQDASPAFNPPAIVAPNMSGAVAQAIATQQARQDISPAFNPPPPAPVVPHPVVNMTQVVAQATSTQQARQDQMSSRLGY